MPTRPGQVFIGFKCSQEFRAEMERAAGNVALSQLIRDAVVEKLKREGHKVADALADAPSRVGKGGRKRQSEQTLRTADTPTATLDTFATTPRKQVIYPAKKSQPR